MWAYRKKKKYVAFTRGLTACKGLWVIKKIQADKNNKYVVKLLAKIDNDFINVYKEYEFMYEEDTIDYTGVIDLMLEYDSYIDIIDYKLKKIDDHEYLKQLNGYKDYINKKTNKQVNLYLYSIIDGTYKKIVD